MMAAKNCKEASLANEQKLTDLKNELRIKQVRVDFALRKQFKLNLVNFISFVTLALVCYQTYKSQELSKPAETPEVPDLIEDIDIFEPEVEEPEDIKIQNITIPDHPSEVPSKPDTKPTPKPDKKDSKVGDNELEYFLKVDASLAELTRAVKAITNDYFEDDLFD